jgi:hypothetical protein
MQTYWFLGLMASICLEGLGRRYIPAIPSWGFLVLKDVLLMWGLFLFRVDGSVQKISKYLYRGFVAGWVAAFGWTLVQVANPENPSVFLAVIGLRSYWLWWIAPPLIATVLQNGRHRRRAIFVLAFLAIGISALGIVQFLSPPDSSINVYTQIEGEELHAAEAGMVYSTGRARVSSTFAFLSGFQDFATLIPVLLLSLGLDTTDRRLRMVSLVAALFTAVATPMSGSRAAVVLGLGSLAITFWTAGLFATRAGRRILLGGAVGVVLAIAVFPDAVGGVSDRFSDVEETKTRVLMVATVLPPVAIATLDYPMMGAGTGIMQNVAMSMRIYPKWPAELEMHRYLVELGPVGFIFAWLAKLGLMVAFWRASRILKVAGRKASAGAALSYAAVTFFGNITFDHVWQALYFVGAGFILAETKAALEILRIRREAKLAAVGPPPVSARV